MSRMDLHIHSCHSKNLFGTKIFGPPSRSFPEDIIKNAIKRGLDVIAVCDHDNILGGIRTAQVAEKKYKGKILVIPGVEISSKDGHILAYNIKKQIPKMLSAEETIKLIKEQGAYAVAAHPFNIKYSLSKKKIEKLSKDLLAIEGINSHSLKNKAVLEYASEYIVPITAGSDGHGLIEIGSSYGETKRKINTFEDLLSVIENRELTLHTGRKNVFALYIFNAIITFFFWKWQQIKHIFNKKVFLPYLDKI